MERWAANLKIINSQNPTLLKAITVMNKKFEEKHLVSGKTVFGLVQSIQSYRVYRYSATSAKHFSVANTAVVSVVNTTFNLARHSKTILSKRM